MLKHVKASASKGWTSWLLMLGVCLLSAMSALAQLPSGALSGIVADTNGAVIPGAKIELKNEASGATRSTVANETGYFKIVSVPVGSYTVKVTYKGFNAWELKGLVFNQGEDKALPKIALKAGAVEETVEVTASVTEVPVDTSEARATLTNDVFSQMNVESRNASELIKILPGMALNTGLSNSAWSTDATATGSGPIGAYSAGGAPPAGGVGISTDGAAILDIGSSNTQVANINQEQTEELTIVSGSFGAEYAKGPVSISAISKSGSNKFHGSVYTYTRAGTFNAEDSQLKVNEVKKPNDHFWYPGFTIGGPVFLPKLGFNKNHDKLFFFFGYEYMMQHPAGTFRESDVPTDDMYNSGDFSAASTLAGISANIPCDSSQASSQWYLGSGSYCATQWADSAVSGGKFANWGSVQDANGMKYITYMRNMGIKPNQTPSAHNGYNYGVLDSTPLNRWEARGKIDYNINDNTKLSGTYTEQREGDKYLYGNMYWWPGGAVHYPTAGQAQVLSRTTNVNLTKTFSTSLTNDFTFAMSYFTLPMKPSNPTAMSPSALGMTMSMPYAASTLGLLDQMPNIVSWSCNTSGQTYGCFPQVYAYSFEKAMNGGVGNIKKVPTFTDNISKTLKTHTIKAGFYWEEDNQTQSNLETDAQGAYYFDLWDNGTTGNPIADLMLGNVASFGQSEGEPVTYVKRYNWDFYLTDQWKYKRLTLNYGMRFEHNGQWFADNPYGLAVWSEASYVNNPSTMSNTSGLLWHGEEPSIPLSGWRSKFIDYSPRVGASYDVFGNGKTVVRGGFGIYRWQVSIGDATGSYMNAEGLASTSKGDFQGLSNVSGLAASVGSLQGSKVNVLMSGDSLTPYTNNWNVIVSQALPWKSTLELQYQGSHTDNSVLANNNNSNGSLDNYNKVSMGKLLTSSECAGNSAYCGSNVTGTTSYYSSPTAGEVQYYRPYKDYLYVSKVTHGSYSNYNAFIAQWQRQTGSVNWIVNYTYSKVLGIQDGNTENGQGNGYTVDTYNLRNNYGLLAYDHTHIFNATYVYHTPNLIHSNPILAQVVNGWELSGITQLQSGAPLETVSNRLNANMPISVNDVLGTPDGNIMPTLTCDPRKGLSKGQYFNPNCFGLPTKGTYATASTTGTLGTNGQYQWPYLRVPAFVSSDLGMFKNFKVREGQKVQFRISSFNFLNHKLKQFGVGDDDQLILNSSGGLTDGASSGVATPFTGKPGGITGRRVMEFALKYEF